MTAREYLEELGWEIDEKNCMAKYKDTNRCVSWAKFPFIDIYEYTDGGLYYTRLSSWITFTEYKLFMEYFEQESLKTEMKLLSGLLKISLAEETCRCTKEQGLR